MTGYLLTGMEVFFGLLLGCVLYLSIPGEGSRKRRKRKRAIARMNETMVGRHTNLASNDTSPPTPPVSVNHGGNPPHQWRAGPRSVWHHEKLNAFYCRYVAPYRKLLKNAGYLKTINALLGLLDEHGDCPSVVKLNADREYQEIRNIYDLLAGISLLDHSLNVAEQMIQNLTKARAKDPEMLMGKILVTALAHDIGKIPQLMETRKYSKGDHPYLSFLVLKKAIFADKAPQQEDILKAVREHHYPVREGFTYDLRRADQKAREMETEQLSLEGHATSELVHMIQEQKISEAQTSNQIRTSSKPKGMIQKIPELVDLSWLDLNGFLSLVEPVINLVEDGTHFRAFSMNNGLVYLMLSLVSDILIQLARKYNHPAILINAGTKQKKRSIEFTVKTMLVKEGLIPSFIGEGYSGARFALLDNVGKKRMVGIYMPLEARAFKRPLAELEKRKKKAPIILEIAEVRPLIGKEKRTASL